MLFLCWLALLIRYCLTCLLQCLTQLALRNTVNMSASPIIITIAIFCFRSSAHSRGKEQGSFRNRNPLSACCCLSPYRACGVVGLSPTLISLEHFFIIQFLAVQFVCSDDELPLFQHFLLYYGFILRKLRFYAVDRLCRLVFSWFSPVLRFLSSSSSPSQLRLSRDTSTAFLSPLRPSLRLPRCKTPDWIDAIPLSPPVLSPSLSYFPASSPLFQTLSLRIPLSSAASHRRNPPRC